MKPNHDPDQKQCIRCGDPVQDAHVRYEEFQTEMAEEIYCPNCQYQKHFGVIQSE